MNSNLNVFFFYNEPRVGFLAGGENRVLELCKRASDCRRLNVTIMLPLIGYSRCINKEIKNANYKIIPFSSYLDKFTGSTVLTPFIYLFRALLLSFKILFSSFNKVDVIYSASVFLPDILPALILKALTGAKWMVIVHHIIPRPSDRKGSYILNSLSYIQDVICLKIIKSNADIVFTFEGIRDKLIDRNFPENKIRITHNGIDLNDIAGTGEEVKIYDAIFVGKLAAHKGIFDLIKIWDNVCRCKRDAVLAIVGGGMGKIAYEVNNLIRNKKLDKNINILGFAASKKEIYKKLKSSKIFIMPSHEEGWSIVIGEAMAAGLPVVAYRLENIVPIWRDNVEWVSLYDTERFANSIVCLLNDERRRAALSKKTSKYAKKYDWNIILNNDIKTICSAGG